MAPFRKFHSIAALCGDGLRPELQALFERLAVDPHSELFVRGDGTVQSGPDPVSEQAPLPKNAGVACSPNRDSDQHRVTRKRVHAADTAASSQLVGIKRREC
jgi:hypothetical protein